MNAKSIILYDAVATGEKYGVYGYPAFFIVSPEGKVIKHFSGFGPSLEQEIIEAMTGFTK